MKCSFAETTESLSPALKYFTIIGAITWIMTGCASSPPEAPPVDQAAIENAIFACKRDFQAKKKARFAKLPRLLQRLAGDNQILGESETPFKKGDIHRAIAKFPLAGDSGGTWGSEKEAHLRTLSTSFDKPRPAKDGTESREVVRLVFGQPGRTYAFPLNQLKAVKGALIGTSGDDVLRISEYDEHHVIVHATTAKRKVQNPAASQFYGRDIHAVIRTYVDQSYSQETASQLSDYPISAPDLNEETCDERISTELTKPTA